MGHESPAITLSVYAHLIDNQQNAAAQALDKLIDGKLDSNDQYIKTAPDAATSRAARACVGSPSDAHAHFITNEVKNEKI